MSNKKANQQKTIWLIVVQYWIPPLITGLLGFGIGLHMAQRADVSTKERLYLECRVKQAEAVAIHFDQYIENWRRLIQIATYEKGKGGLDEDDRKRKNGYVVARNDNRDKLFGAMGALDLYFGPTVLQNVTEFRTWADAQTIKPLEQLPSLNEWRKHKSAVISAIRRELEGKL